MTDLVPIEQIDRAILTVRGQRVMLDADLAELYCVETRALNQAVRRNLDRFPEDFAFVLTIEEWADLRSQSVILKAGRGQHRKFPPYVFTEHGAVMLASVLSSPRAVEASILVARAFVRLRRLLGFEAEILRRMEALEARAEGNEIQTAMVAEELKEIRSLMSAPITSAIGFRSNDPPSP
ncbi:MAG: ORF6N domain-containing protein [Candidatus Sericytochromatia bacterium]|nr:ORF6N domain-containing protein [Candidatus Tanganyikabacteria bacterium]